MRKNPFKNQEFSLRKQFVMRKKLLKPFIKKYGEPVIVHAVQNKRAFKKILKEGKIKIPREHNSPKITPYMRRILKMDNCIYYSLGFVYYSAYKWKYNFIFSLENLRDMTYYSKSISFKAYKTAVDYWYENDRGYLDKLANLNRNTRKVMNRYYYEKYNGEVGQILEFWKIEKQLFDFIIKYPHRSYLFKIINSLCKKYFFKYPSSRKRAMKDYAIIEKAPEIISRKNNNLLRNPYFRGFYIAGSIEKEVLSILKKKYSDKIIFDGKKIKNVRNI